MCKRVGWLSGSLHWFWRKNVWRAALLAIAVLGLFGCNRSPSEASGGTEESEVAPRVVSLHPAITETLDMLGARSQLVATSDYCQETGLPRVGSAITPNLQAIAEAEPTLILVTKVAGAQLTDVHKLGRTVELPWLTVEEAADSVSRLGQLVGKGQRGDALAGRMRTTFANKPAIDAPRVLLLMGSFDVGSGDVWFVRADSLHGSVLAAAGYRNVVGAAAAGPPRMSVERLIELDPEAILVVRGEAPDSAEEARLVESVKKLKPLSAVKNDRVGVLSRRTLLRTGPGIVDEVEHVRSSLDELLAR